MFSCSYVQIQTTLPILESKQMFSKIGIPTNIDPEIVAGVFTAGAIDI